jgi:hypothetical protein
MAHPIKDNFSLSDIEQIQNEGLTLDDIYHQIEIFKKGIAPIKINGPGTIGDGINIIDDTQSKRFLDLHQQASQNGRLMKFVPASGAASRMFKDWYKFLDQKAFDSPREATVFL